MKALNLSELTVEQKIGQILCARGFLDEEDRAFIYKMIKERSLGAIQIHCSDEIEQIKKIKEIADYPILICKDLETGYDEIKIPCALALAAIDDEELAYTFGEAMGIEAANAGYTNTWGPCLDTFTTQAPAMTTRGFGSNTERISRLASAVIRGMQDNGIIATAKHFPGARDVTVDTHMAEGKSNLTKQELLDVDIVPFIHAMKEADLGAVMTTHGVFTQIDDRYPATMSKKVLSILRDAGFDGLIESDSFAMMGILQKHGEENCYGIAVDAGVDLILPNYRVPLKKSYEYLLSAYKNGLFTEERLNEAVKRVIATQEKTLRPFEKREITDKHRECMERVKREGICVVKDDNVSSALEPGKKRLFVVLAENIYDDHTDDVVREWTVESGGSWDKANEVIKEIKVDFPDDNYIAINVFPSRFQIENVCFEATKADEVVFVTFNEAGAYISSSNLTRKVVRLMEALEDKLSALIHFGNPFATELAPHFPRRIFSMGGVEMKYPLMILKGEIEGTEKLPMDIKLR